MADRYPETDDFTKVNFIRFTGFSFLSSIEALEIFTKIVLIFIQNKNKEKNEAIEEDLVVTVVPAEQRA